jgi:hypothetical protein
MAVTVEDWVSICMAGIGWGDSRGIEMDGIGRLNVFILFYYIIIIRKEG